MDVDVIAVTVGVATVARDISGTGVLRRKAATRLIRTLGRPRLSSTVTCAIEKGDSRLVTHRGGGTLVTRPIYRWARGA
jgi:hypothetical protein